MQLLVATLVPKSSAPADALVCSQFNDAYALRSALTEETPFDLLLLDYNYDEFSGLALLRWVRNFLKSNVPIMMLSQRNSERDIAEVLAAGAQDFVAKPFRPIELRARIERFRPKQSTKGCTETFADWTLFHDSGLVILAGSPDQVFDLSEREFSLAVALFRNLGCVVSRYDLLEATNQTGRSMNTRILDNQIFKLRKTLALEENGLLLQTLYGHGYRLVANTHGHSPSARTERARHRSPESAARS